MKKRVKFTKGRHVVGHGAYEPNDEVSFEEDLAGQLVNQQVAEYVETAKPRQMVEEKAEVKTAEMKITRGSKNVLKDLDFEEEDFGATD